MFTFIIVIDPQAVPKSKRNIKRSPRQDWIKVKKTHPRSSELFSNHIIYAIRNHRDDRGDDKLSCTFWTIRDGLW